MKKFTPLFLLSFLLTGLPSFSQEKGQGLSEKKGAFYFYWGYNRSYFTTSDIHFSGPDYDFTLYDVDALDRPEPLGSVYFNPNTISVPQYNFRLGYYLNERLSISGGMDHLKYVVVQDQTSSISGYIAPEASPKYAGSYYEDDIVLSKDFLEFEHTNGFNLVSLEAEYLFPLFKTCEDKLAFLWSVGAGGGLVVTKTDVRVMEEGLDNEFHMSGYFFAAKTGPRIEYKNRIFLTAEVKSGYSNLPDVRILNSGPQRAEHSVNFLEYYIAVGYNFRIPFLYPKEKVE